MSKIKNTKQTQYLLIDWEDEDDIDDELLEENFEFSPLDEIESSQLYLLYTEFIKEYFILENKNTT